MSRILSLNPEGPGALPPAAGEEDPSGVWLRPKPPCANHPRVTATSSCLGCMAAICTTCAFVFPGGRTFCPACASAPRDRLTGSRRTAVVWSFILGSCGSLGILSLPVGALLFAPLDDKGQAGLGMVTAVFGMLPALVGLALSIGAWEKHAANPTMVWVGIIWNAALIGIVFLLSALGLLMNLSS